jgi:Zn-dependent protease with chaperone function/cytochrome c-type biogenesis protein CcmH/NrfG
MSLGTRHRLVVLFLVGMMSGLAAAPIRAQNPPPAAVPSADEIADLLRREPFSLETWPKWRSRLLAWMVERSHNPDAAYEAARSFMRRQADAAGNLPQPLAEDAVAWYLLGSAYLYEPVKDAEQIEAGRKAEQAFRRSLQLDPKFARSHRNLAMALSLQAAPASPAPGLRVRDTRRTEVQKELEEARKLDPSLNIEGVKASIAMRQKDFERAEALFQQALQQDPQDNELARGAAVAVVSNSERLGRRAPVVKVLLDKFPNDGHLICFYGLALAEDNDLRGATREFARARHLGVDPADLFSKELVGKIEAGAGKIEARDAPDLVEYALWTLGGFVAFYAVWMLLMAGVGALLAGRTRGDRALQLLETQDELIVGGQVVRTRHESSLARFYVVALFASLILFYVSLPFLIVGLLAGTGLLLYLVFMLPRIPVKLIVIIVVVGLGGAWAVFKSIFARPGKGSFGLPKTAEQCPRIYEVLNEVAQRVDTEPVHEVYLAPGSAIGVHQEGRGPFGIFGVSRRVLTLGVSTLRFLTVGELKSILAHEYAHFSHQDTFYSRFIYQVTLSIQEALQGMGRTGGWYNYVNPFLWFLILYHKAYTLLSAGFSRSREFLADRMAASLYGSDVFTSALTKVCTDGTLFEMTMYDNIANLLKEGKAFVNMYEAFRGFRDEQLNTQERDDLYKKLLEEKESLFASHPTFGERIAAVKPLPPARHTDTTPALTLCENAEEIEKEMTDFLTGYIYHLHQLQTQAAT